MLDYTLNEANLEILNAYLWRDFQKVFANLRTK